MTTPPTIVVKEISHKWVCAATLEVSSKNQAASFKCGTNAKVVVHASSKTVRFIIKFMQISAVATAVTQSGACEGSRLCHDCRPAPPGAVGRCGDSGEASPIAGRKRDD